MPFVSSSNNEGCFIINDDGMIWFVVMRDNEDKDDDDTCEWGDAIEWKEFAGEGALCGGVKGVNVLLWMKLMFVNVGVSLGVGVCVDIEWRWCLLLWDDVLIKSCLGGWGGERILIRMSLSLLVLVVGKCFELSGWLFVFVFLLLNLVELSHGLSSSVRLEVLRFLWWGKLLEVISLFKSFMKELLSLEGGDLWRWLNSGLSGFEVLFGKQHCYIWKEIYMNIN